MAKITNELFIVGDGDTTNGDYKEPMKISGNQVANEVPGFPITAADFNTYLRSMSLVTYSFIDAIKDGEKTPSSTAVKLGYDTKEDEAKTMIKNSLDGYIFNSELYQSNNLKGKDPKAGDIYYIDSVNNGKAVTGNLHIDEIIFKTDHDYCLMTGRFGESTTKPSWIESKRIICGSSDYIKDHNSNTYKKFSFSIDTTNKILTINFENK